MGLCVLVACGQPPAATVAITEAAHTATLAPTLTAIQIAEQTETAIDIADIWIEAPGPDSLATSPLAIEAQLAPGADGHVRIELIDANGRLLAVQVLELTSNELQTQIAFELGRPSLAARLTISTKDEYGRTQALNSVDLTLLASGAASIFPPAGEEQIVIEQPQAGEELARGSLLVGGQAQTQPGRPLTVQLITRAGRVLAFREVYPQDGNFKVEFNLDLDEPTWLQVAVFESGGLAPGVAHFAGLEVLVRP
jgi:hypothetical protein